MSWKKNNLFLVFLISVFIGITIFQYHTYQQSYQDKLNAIMHEIVTEYPTIQVNELAEIMKSEKIYDTTILAEFGYDETYFLVSSVQSKMYLNILLNVSIVILIFFVYLGIQKKKQREEKIEIGELINHLHAINNGDYSLHIEQYTESDFSKLRSEIFQTMILLKKHEEYLVNEKDVMKNNLADLSHQLKTPLTSIMLMLDNIVEFDDMDKQTRKKFIQSIYINVDKIEFIVQVLLKLSKLDAQVIVFKQEKVAVQKVLEKVVSNVAMISEQKNISVLLHIPSDVHIKMDVKWQEEALTNILKNAIEHSHPSEKVEIFVEDTNFYTKISVVDYGEGMDEQMLQKLFTRFHPSSTSNGVGIGLHLAKTIIEKESGLIKVVSKKGEFTKIEVKYMKQ